MPRVRLNFPNVLNTSVQVGDYAYFSNPRAVGPVREYPNENGGVPGGGTHTPHMTNDQSEIIMIGEILEVGEWLYEDNLPIRSHDTFAGRPPVPNAGFIICDMPQDLFNQYWDQIANGKCETTVLNTGTGTGDCNENFLYKAIDYPVYDMPYTGYINGPGFWGYSSTQYSAPELVHALKYLFQNPDYPADQVLFHHSFHPGSIAYWHSVVPMNRCDPATVPPGVSPLAAQYPNDGTPCQYCELGPDDKNVPGIGSDVNPARENAWTMIGGDIVIETANAGPNGTYLNPVVGSGTTNTPHRGNILDNTIDTTNLVPQPRTGGVIFGNTAARIRTMRNIPLNQWAIQTFTANDIIDKFNILYPNSGYVRGMSWDQFWNHHLQVQTQVMRDNWTQNYGGDFTNNSFVTAQGAQPPLSSFEGTYGLKLEVTGPSDVLHVSGAYSPDIQTDCEDPSYIMFSKDNKANMSSLVGYYASVELRNNSLDKAELFNVGSVFTESSK